MRSRGAFAPKNRNLGQDWADHAVTKIVATWLWISGRQSFIFFPMASAIWCLYSQLMKPFSQKKKIFSFVHSKRRFLPSLTISDHLWSSLTILDHPWLSQNIFEHFWPYMTITIYDYIQPYMTIYTIYNQIWPYITLYETYMTIYDHIWPYMTIYDHIWP